MLIGTFNFSKIPWKSVAVKIFSQPTKKTKLKIPKVIEKNSKMIDLLAKTCKRLSSYDLTFFE